VATDSRDQWTRSWRRSVLFDLQQGEAGFVCVMCACAGTNRHVVGNERVLQERSSEPSWPRVLRWSSRGGHRSVNRGISGLGIELRKIANSGRRPCAHRGKATPASACFNTATICSTLNRFCFTANLPSSGTRFCRKLTTLSAHPPPAPQHARTPLGAVGSSSSFRVSAS
jgi:hypothetical protein